MIFRYKNSVEYLEINGLSNVEMVFFLMYKVLR